MYTTRKQQLENYLATQAKNNAMQDMKTSNVNTKVFDALFNNNPSYSH
jgi:hypothetical protein